MPINNEELILETLAEVVPGGRHSIVIGEAMRNAGLLDVPSDAVAFRSFVQGPLRRAVHLVLGEVAAAQIIGRLVVDLSGTASDGTIPLGSQHAHTPSPPRQRAAVKAPKRVASTIGYGEDAKSSVDVAIIGSDPTTQELLREMLSQRGYRLFAVDSVARVVVLCEQIDVEVVLAMAEPDGFDHAVELRAMLGDAAPAVILLSHAAPPPEPRDGVVAVLPKRIDGSLIDSIDAVVESYRR